MVAEDPRPTRFRLVKFGRRPLLAVPQAGRRLRLAGLGCYPAHTWKKQIVRACLRAGAHCGLERCLGAKVESPLAEVAAQALAEWQAWVRWQLGDRGLEPVYVWPADPARGRVYVHWLDSDGRKAAFAKLALDASNADLILNEQHALEQLNRMAALQVRVPRVLAAGELQGLAFLVVESLPPHARITDWAKDPPLESLIQDYAGPPHRMSFADLQRAPWWSRFCHLGWRDRGFAEAVRAAAADGLDVCRAHGDLNQTNVLRTGGEVWLLDWEQSSDTAPCLTDPVCVATDRLWPLTRRDAGKALQAFLNAMWRGQTSEHHQRVLLALAFLCAAEFPPAMLLAANWPSQMHNGLQAGHP